MSDVWADAQADEYYEAFYDEHAKRAREEFKWDRLRSYYIANPALVVPAWETLEESRRLLNISPRAALVLATSSAEMVISQGILRPIVFGLVHSESVANEVADTVLAHRALNRFKELLIAIASELAGVDLTQYRRIGATRPFLDELGLNQTTRNGVIHLGASPDARAATSAIELATSTYEELLPAILKSLRLHVHDDAIVCGQEHLPPEIEKLLLAEIEKRHSP